MQHSLLIKLFGELFNDVERSSISKEENQLHQTLVMFLQQHQDISLHNVLITDDAEPSKKLCDYSHLKLVFSQCLSSANASNDLPLAADAKEMLKNRAELSAAREGEEDQYATANTEYAVADSGQHFCISGADVIDGEREELPR